MNTAELRGLAQLACQAVAGTADRVEEMHLAIAQRSFRASGPFGRPAHLLHNAVARTAYAGVRLAGRLGGSAAARLPLQMAGPSLADSRRGRFALGALNGALGDRLEREGSGLRIQMTLTPTGAAAPRIAVFLHGLMETEDSWGNGSGTYASRLQRDLGHTPVQVRYNTGLPVSENGRLLCSLLQELVAGWPVPVEEVVLVGHSMGGLVAHSACHHAALQGARWLEPLHHVVCLGCPHLGAPLEKAAHATAYVLHLVPETRALARIVDGRSAGIRDLRLGYASAAEPAGRAAHRFVAATLGREPDSLVSRLLGDIFVRLPSASAIPEGRHLGGLNHFDLLNHPAVYEQIREWLRPAGGGKRPQQPALSG